MRIIFNIEIDIQDGDAVWPKLFHKVTKRALISNESRLWPNNVIYYKIDTQFTGMILKMA